MHTQSLTISSSKLTYPVLVKQEQIGVWSVQVLGWSESKVHAAAREEALSQLRQFLTEQLANAELIQLEIDHPNYKNPWLELAGKYKDDPQFEEMLAYIEADRRTLDAEMQDEFELEQDQGG